MQIIIVRPASLNDCPAIARVQVDSYLDAYAGMFPPSYFAHFTYEEQTDDWKTFLEAKDSGQILLVADGATGQVCGYCLAKLKKDIYPGYNAELVAMHVLPRLRRKGIGRHLLQNMKVELHAQGTESVMLWTLQGNPIRSWYEKIGGVLIGEKQYDVDNWKIIEVAYGWNKLEQLKP
jgi:ribosomal protein S18 acetylase RimI-like enzyme